MVCPPVVDGGGNLQIWRVAVNRLNTQSQIADKGFLQLGGWMKG
jgi:hypothetical protein